MVYQILIELDKVQPRIWRRVRVESDITMRTFHHVVQIAMGWENCHLYTFDAKGEKISQIDFLEDDDFLEDHEVILHDFLKKAGDKMSYTYDFGDDWKHFITLEKIVEDDGSYLPTCIEGERACPPEDIGGLPGYLEFVKIMKNPRDAEYDERVDWYGGVYDAEAFRLDLINEDMEDLDDYIESTETDWIF